jgi:hypothetical protein
LALIPIDTFAIFWSRKEIELVVKEGIKRNKIDLIEEILTSNGFK